MRLDERRAGPKVGKLTFRGKAGPPSVDLGKPVTANHLLELASHRSRGTIDRVAAAELGRKEHGPLQRCRASELEHGERRARHREVLVDPSHRAPRKRAFAQGGFDEAGAPAFPRAIDQNIDRQIHARSQHQLILANRFLQSARVTPCRPIRTRAGQGKALYEALAKRDELIFANGLSQRGIVA